MAELGALKDYGSSVAAVAVRDFLKSEAERKKAYQELQKILIKVMKACDLLSDVKHVKHFAYNHETPQAQCQA
eukprot:1143693-Pelagomonas_calceolata.AAC.3